jgi:hypothetical protein
MLETISVRLRFYEFFRKVSLDSNRRRVRTNINMKPVLFLCLALEVFPASRIAAQSERDVAPAVAASNDHGLRIPAIAWAASVAADQITTYQFASKYRSMLRERNVLIRGLDRHPALLVAAGTAIDATMGWASYRWLGTKHPRLAKLAFFGAATYRAYLAGHNIQAMRRADRILESAGGSRSSTPLPK